MKLLLVLSILLAPVLIWYINIAGIYQVIKKRLSSPVVSQYNNAH